MCYHLAFLLFVAEKCSFNYTMFILRLTTTWMKSLASLKVPKSPTTIESQEFNLNYLSRFFRDGREPLTRKTNRYELTFPLSSFFIVRWTNNTANCRSGSVCHLTGALHPLEHILGEVRHSPRANWRGPHHLRHIRSSVNSSTWYFTRSENYW
jgi:hypothetical protein